MKDSGSVPIAFDQVTGHLPVSCQNLQHYQQQNQLGQYTHNGVSQGHHHCQQLSFNAIDHGLRQGQLVSVGSTNPSSVLEAEKMSSGEVRRVSRQDIQLVQNLIERCLQLYMNQKEVVYTLLDQAKIEPGFTELVWQKLEEENHEFFKAYHVRLMVKNQILFFNKLLKQQVELTQNICPTAVSTTPISNGSHITFQRAASSYVPEHSVASSSTPEKIHQPMGGPSSILINGGGTSMHRGMHGIDELPTHTGRMDMSPNMLLAQNAHLSMLQEANGVAIKSEPGYSGAAFTFSGDTSTMENCPIIGDASTSFSSTESNSQVFIGPLLDADISSSFGFLDQIPQNFSLSDLTADFPQSSDILENYSRSPFLAHDTDDFMDSPEMECQGEERRLETISEGPSYEEFGSD